ncbi:transposase [Lactococcus garvieae]|uniref:transposase n=1 Tax=Lactococcus garvieae TaxID=1363 RepID=UPI0038530C5C
MDTLSVMTIQVEISDFSHFVTVESFCAYLGLTPSEQSSAYQTSLKQKLTR